MKAGVMAVLVVITTFAIAWVVEEYLLVNGGITLLAGALGGMTYQLLATRDRIDYIHVIERLAAALVAQGEQ